MTTLTKTCLNICETDSHIPSQTNTSSCDCGYYTGQINNAYFNFGDLTATPDGSTIASATLVLAQVSGGYSHTENLHITLRSGDWYAMSWADHAPVVSAAGTISTSLTGASAGDRSFDVTSIVQWMVDNDSTSHIFLLARDPNAISGSLDAKRFSTTPGNHSLVIVYTAPAGVTKTRSFSWDVANRVSRTRAIQYRVFRPVQQTRQFAYSVARTVSKTLESTWDALGGVAVTLETTYDVASALLPVSVTLESTWGCGGPVSATLDMTWRTEVGLAHSMFHIRFWARKYTEVEFTKEEA